MLEQSSLSTLATRHNDDRYLTDCDSWTSWPCRMSGAARRENDDLGTISVKPQDGRAKRHGPRRGQGRRRKRPPSSFQPRPRPSRWADRALIAAASMTHLVTATRVTELSPPAEMLIYSASP